MAELSAVTRRGVLLLPIAAIIITGLAAGRLTGVTHARYADHTGTPALHFRTLSTHDLLRVEGGPVSLEATAQQDGVTSSAFWIRNIGDRRVSLSVELRGISWLEAHLDRDGIGPGEEVEVYVTGVPAEPGHYAGYITVYGMGRYLELSVPVEASVKPAPRKVQRCQDEVRPPGDELPLPAEEGEGEAPPADGPEGQAGCDPDGDGSGSPVPPPETPADPDLPPDPEGAQGADPDEPPSDHPITPEPPTELPVELPHPVESEGPIPDEVPLYGDGGPPHSGALDADPGRVDEQPGGPPPEAEATPWEPDRTSE